MAQQEEDKAQGRRDEFLCKARAPSGTESRPEQAVVIATMSSAGITVLGTLCLQHGQENNSSHLRGEKQSLDRAWAGSRAVLEGSEPRAAATQRHRIPAPKTRWRQEVNEAAEPQELLSVFAPFSPAVKHRIDSA